MNLYSHRRKLTEGSYRDVYVYDDIPKELRIQIIHIWNSAIGVKGNMVQLTRSEWWFSSTVWNDIQSTISREHGVINLNGSETPSQNCIRYLLDSSQIDRIIDIIEYSFQCIYRTRNKLDRSQRSILGITQEPDDAIQELNTRFQRAGVGYRFENQTIIRIDSEFMHAEVAQPVLQFLNIEGFEGPLDEFMSAHRHYRKGELKEAIVSANCALESTLKTICRRNQWLSENTGTVPGLLKIARKNGLFPEYMEASFEQLVATLKSGLPKIRNNEAAHGQGPVPTTTPDHIAAYALHLAAAQILFLGRSFENYNR